MVKSREAKLNSVFHALADTTRRGIMKNLSVKERAISEIARPFNMSLVAVSKHIKILERAELVARRWEGSYSYVRLNPKAMKTADAWMEFYRKFWEQGLERLEVFLQEEQEKKKKI